MRFFTLLEPRTAALAAAILLLATSPSFAQEIPDVNSEIPTPSLTGNEARPLAMGGAGIAVSEDGSAVYWNPAGLAQMRRIEASATVIRDETDFRSSLGDIESSRSSTNLGSARLVYPVPTYRGSFVFALGSDQFRNYDQEFEFESTVGSAGQRLGLHDTISERGKLTGWSVALAFEASPKVSIGGVLFLHDGEDKIAIRQITTDLDDANPDTFQLDDVTEIEADISGVSGTIGVLYRIDPRFRIGATLRTPTQLTFEGTQVFDDLTVLDPSHGSAEIFSPIDEVLFEDKYDFPFSFGVGGAATLGGLTLATDLRYTDWSQISTSGSPLLDRDIADQYAEKVGVYSGAEFLLPSFPLRLRGGFFYDPVPFRLFEPNAARPTEIQIDRDRLFGTFGVGVLVETVLTFDVAVQIGSYTRQSSTYSEERELSRVILSSAYRF